MSSAKGPLAPAFAKSVIRTCSFKLNGPGLSEKDQFVSGILTSLVGNEVAISFPIGKLTI